MTQDGGEHAEIVGSFNFKSIYSAAQINQSSTRLGKIAWFLVLIVTFVGSINEIYKFYYSYSEYRVVLSLHLSQEQSLIFPAVTICNLNRIDSEIEMRSEHDVSTPLIFSNLRSLQYCEKIENGTLKVYHRNEAATNALMEFYKMNETERLKQGIDLNNFLQSCSFNGRRCKENRLSVFLNFRFGNCITFYKRNPNLFPLRVSEIGINSGLALKLNLMTAGYQSTVNTYGAKVVIHDPNQSPNPEDDGIFISPGHDTVISLKQTLYRRLPHPYRDRCRDYEAETSSPVRNKNDCIRACILKKGYEKCGCIDPSLGITSSFKPCNLTNAKESCCLNEVLDAMARNGYQCDCPLPCSSLYYNEQISRSLLVSREKMFRAIDRRFLKDGVVMLKVFYSSKEKYTYEQKPKWDVAQLLSAIGNELGLWLGLSVVAIFELLEKFIMFVKNVFLLPLSKVY